MNEEKPGYVTVEYCQFERQMIIRNAAILANALNDIYAVCGEIPEVAAFYHEAESVINDYADLENVGLSDDD